MTTVTKLGKGINAIGAVSFGVAMLSFLSGSWIGTMGFYYGLWGFFIGVVCLVVGLALQKAGS